jgi:hypothetical protein
LLLTDCTWSLCIVTHRLYLEFMFCYSPVVPGVYVLLLRLYHEFMFCYSQIAPGVYVLLLTDCIVSLCFVTHKLHLEFMFYYSPIVS